MLVLEGKEKEEEREQVLVIIRNIKYELQYLNQSNYIFRMMIEMYETVQPPESIATTDHEYEVVDNLELQGTKEEESYDITDCPAYKSVNRP